ncbi:hypothetical protein PLEOSDRAFT_1065723 [Pleurotus ostreatus PC15]|uniref:FAD/NAD(P)-binding domain-containing protein n=2 Tax=Pleurotus TaxID=5320 RepID=A0A067NEQ1_PLEO1|nr:hypothetical protein CCMSSC00406_0007855 [Pleurotus cornucopiae]KDQ26304.1 hypothetical protein PLEOSDRAFT_1065723 [Pleurotus ostreatus PC15]
MPLEVEIPLPTLDTLGAAVPADLDAKHVATEWFRSFASLVESGDADAVADLFLDHSAWRDILSLTWDFRTFAGREKIRTFLNDRLSVAEPHSFKLDTSSVGLQTPYPDLAWIQAFFSFDTGVGICSGIVRLVPTASEGWKAHAMFTNLEDLKGFPEKTGPLRNPAPNHGKWEADRRREVAFEDGEPTVLIVGGGQSGLEVAARLKCLGVSALVVERNPRIGDNWRQRYEALCLHDPVWYDHMPYLPFPSTWPVYAPSKKLANWLEGYAEIMELNVWTSASVEKVVQDKSPGKWMVTVRRANGDRTFKANHVIFATGIGGGKGNLPVYPGMDVFQGQTLHSTQHNTATDHTGKKVVVIGSGSSAHDICANYYEKGVDVTMFQRSSTYIMSIANGWKYLMDALYSEDAPPVDVADRLNASFPNSLVVDISRRQVQQIAAADKELLDGLKRVGFRTNLGYKNAGSGLLAWDKAGGYYLDVGASQLIIDGKIKLKSGPHIECFTKTGLKFDDGSELNADVVLFATGLGDSRSVMRSVCDEEVSSKVGRVWGLDPEGEIYGAWRDVGVQNMWIMTGNLALCRFHSKHLALQIKAIEEGVFGSRYQLGGSLPN